MTSRITFEDRESLACRLDRVMKAAYPKFRDLSLTPNYAAMAAHPGQDAAFALGYNQALAEVREAIGYDRPAAPEGIGTA